MGQFSGMDISSSPLLKNPQKVAYLKTTAHLEIVFLYELTKQKICKIVVALVKRNQISTWPMWKLDFCMGRVEI